MRYLALLLAPLISGCATLMNGSTQPINVQTVPPGAECAFKGTGSDPRVIRIASPGVAVLARGDNYTVTCEKEGYAASMATLRATTSGWLAGNIVTGLIPGIIVDEITGAADDLSPSILTLQLSPTPIASH